MAKTLVAYFSASGVTKAVAERLAAAIGAELYEIRPAVPYTDADLDWTDNRSRSTREMQDKAFRPAVLGAVEDMSRYDTLFVGFPIWWYVAPTVVNTFLEQYDLTGKTLVPFATSGSSGMGRTNAALAPSCPGAVLRDGRRFAAGTEERTLKAWADAFLGK